MRLLIDCNVIVSAALRSAACIAVLAEAESSHIVLISDEILAEYRRVATYKKFPPHVQARMRDIIEDMAIRAEYLPTPVSMPAAIEAIADAKDVMYVVAAHTGRAEAIITGNTRHFVEKTYGGALVVSVREFLDMVGA